MTYATVCSGIECMSAACADLPMKPVFFSEIEPFPCAVLKSHFPNVPNLGDMSKDVSVAGKRGGMQEGSGTRSSLAFEFIRLVRELKPRYVLWENVAGVLSDKSFPKFLTALADCGYGVAYRTLDAQWIRADGVSQSLLMGTAPGHKNGVVISTNSNGGDVMPTLDGKGQSASGPGAQEDKRGGYVIQRKEARSYGINPAMSGMMIGTTVPLKECGLTLRKSPGGENGVIWADAIAGMKYIVRRLTPTECERLMGLPDGWTIPSNLKVTDELVEEFCRVHDNFNRIMAEYEGKAPPKPKTANQVRKWLEKIVNPDTCPDAPRYKGRGNGWATNQPRWILSRMLTKDGIDPFSK